MNEEILRIIVRRLRLMSHHARTVESKEYYEKGHPDLSVYKDGQASGLLTAVNMLEFTLAKALEAQDE